MKTGNCIYGEKVAGISQEVIKIGTHTHTHTHTHIHTVQQVTGL